ncbi:hypothetical protein [Streptomyces malaysiensis]|uniref:hypothetical protein n=1 Tax=Streptomyces malaysiensis TaxID=92644 RepID=UPI0037148F36
MPAVGVVDHLTADPVGPRELKYAVLHLHAAAEVLLKARLQQEHWSLVFDDPRKATRKAFESGNFQSCGITDTVTRLNEIAGVPLTATAQKALKSLGRDRNALQHYGLTHNARAIEARAGQALDFLVRFLDDELQPQLSDDTVKWVRQDMLRKLREGLRNIRAYRTERRKRLLGTLKDVAHRTLECQECGELALIARDHCHFCSYPFGSLDPEDAADLYMSYRHFEPQELISDCPRCTRRTMAQEVVTAGSTGPVAFCFNCDAPIPSMQAGAPTATSAGRP